MNGKKQRMSTTWRSVGFEGHTETSLHLAGSSHNVALLNQSSKAWRIWIRAWQKAGVADSTEFALRKAFCLPPSDYPSFGYAFSTDADSIAAIDVLVQIDAR